MSYDFAINYIKKENELSDEETVKLASYLNTYYNLVYEYEDDKPSKSHISFLESVIWNKFNIDKPADFIGHSLSVSDIVSINDELFYCDSYGWVDL